MAGSHHVRLKSPPVFKRENEGNKKKRVCQNTLFITEDRYIAELSYKVAI